MGNVERRYSSVYSDASKFDRGGPKVEHAASAKLYPSCKPASANASQPRLSYPAKLPCTQQQGTFRISRTENSIITDTWNAVDDYFSRGLVKSDTALDAALEA